MDDIKDPKYVVGYFGYDYKNVCKQFDTREDIEVLNLMDVYDEDLSNENKISSFICEVNYFDEQKKGYTNILYDLISANKIDGIPIIGIQRDGTTPQNISNFKNFVSTIDSDLNDWLKTPSIRCPIDISSGTKTVRDYSVVADAVESNQILRGNEYKNAMAQIKNTVKDWKSEYMSVFSEKIKDTIRQNRDKTKEEIKKYVSMSIISTISVMAIKMGREVEEQLGKQDEYTKGHVNSTSAISNMLAEELSNSEEIMAQYVKEKNPKEKAYTELDEESKLEYKAMMFNDVSAAGLLHDAGKLAIAMHKYPNKGTDGKVYGYYSLLDAPRRLTNEEFAVIQTHPDIGYNILMEVARSIEETLDKNLNVDLEESLQMIGKGILYHHERVDGNGYHSIPDSEFPVIAKIIQTADIYDALISERAYKFAWPDKFARKEMRRDAGKQCDEKYLDALDRIIERVRQSEESKAEFCEAIGRQNLIWDVEEIQDENKRKTLIEISKRNDARKGTRVSLEFDDKNKEGNDR